VTARANVFGDEDHLFVVEMNAQGNPTGTRTLRAYDGATVKDVKDFTALYNQRVMANGRNILVADKGAKNTTLRLYDVLEGKDVWKKEFAANSTVIKAENDNLAGAVEPDGKFTVLDLATQKEVLKNEIDPKYLEKVQNVSLVRDNSLFYLATNKPADPNLAPWGGTRSAFLPQTGVRSLPVNGVLYAFDRETQAVKWRVDAEDQMLLLDSLNELPMVILASFSPRNQGNGPNKFITQAIAVKVVEKRTGKLKYDNKELLNNQGQQFHTLNVDPKNNKIEMITWNFKLTLTPNTEGDGGAGKDGKDKQPGGTPMPGGQGGQPAPGPFGGPIK
jgi:hypothetical protein